MIAVAAGGTDTSTTTPAPPCDCDGALSQLRSELSDRMGTHFSKRGGHHSGVMTGHEVMVYTFMSGTQCQPKRRKFARSSKRYSRSSINLGRDHKTLSVQKLSRSPSPASVRLRKVNNYNTRASLDLDLVRGEERILDSYSRGVENGSGNNHGNANIEIEISSLESNSEVINLHSAS